MVEFLAVVGWGVSGFFAYGLAFGYFQRKFACIAVEGRRGDQVFASVMAAMGPLGLVTALLCSGFGRRGLQWKLWSKPHDRPPLPIRACRFRCWRGGDLDGCFHVWRMK